jgi:glycosyltransferase involved in cell wall biosynthesis
MAARKRSQTMNLPPREPTDVHQLSVVIPAFNRERTIERAISSALDQSMPPDLVLVVDDGSTDATRERVERFGSLVSLVQQENGGASAARNRGVEAVDSEWVAFLDSDDHWTPGHLERIRVAIDETSGAADMYFADAASAEFPDGRSLWDLSGFEIDGTHRFFEDATDLVMRPLHPFAIQSSVIRRVRYDQVGGMWPQLPAREDTHLFFVLGLGRPFCAVAGVGVEITSDDLSGTRLTQALGSDGADYGRCTVRLYQDVLDRFPDLGTEHRKSLRARLVDGYVAQASADLSQRNPRGLKLLATAFRHDPRATVQRGVGAMRNRRDPRV